MNFRRMSEADQPVDRAAEARPARRIAVLTCMDTRIDPYELLGLRVGDAHILRNAGGLVTDDAIRSLAVSQATLGTTEVVLIQHTLCGLLGVTNDEIADRIEAESGRRPPWSPGAFSDLDQGVREGLEAIRSCPFLPHRDAVRGFVLDIESGDLRGVG